MDLSYRSIVIEKLIVRTDFWYESFIFVNSTDLP